MSKRPQAKAAEWYAERVVGLGERFLLETEAAFARIVEPRIIIVAVAHLHRRPGYWVQRLDQINVDRAEERVNSAKFGPLA